jgi:hypothetical protein
MFTKNTQNEIVCKLIMQNENVHFLEVCKSSDRIFISNYCRINAEDGLYGMKYNIY